MIDILPIRSGAVSAASVLILPRSNANIIGVHTEIRVHRATAMTSADERDPEQDWFWSDEWQAAEMEVEENLRDGDYSSFASMDDFLATL